MPISYLTSEMFIGTTTQMSDPEQPYYAREYGYTKVFHAQTVQWWEDQSDRIAMRLGLPVKKKESTPELLVWDNEGGKGNGLV
ncbi:hypothetical protein SEA_KEELAN_18 [Gordonia phage Keelan]|nr:hypothetical protein SEA_KEELAN_18 [Gordonia phage Keelan]